METRLEVFRSAVTLVFNNWTALRLAAEHHIGLPQGKDMAMKFVDHIVEVFANRDSLDWEEVADILENVMDSQFETFCDDNSTEEVGTILCQFYQQCMAGDFASVETKMAKLPKCQLWLSKPLQSPPTVAKEKSPTEDQGKQSASSEEMEVIEDEWTQVKSRRKKENCPL